MSSDQQVTRRVTPRERPWFRGGIAVVLAAAGIAAWYLARPSVDELLVKSRAALDRGQPHEAKLYVQRALGRAPRSARALLAAGEIELALDQPDQALAFFVDVDDDGSAASVSAALRAANMLLEQRRVSEGERYLRRVIAADREHLAAHRRLARVLNMAGRREAVDHYLELVRHGDFNTNELALLGNPEDFFDYPELTTVFESAADGDREIALGAAHYASHRHEISQAERQYRRLVAAAPDDADAQAGWGAALVEIGTPEEFGEWDARLPEGAAAHPGVWVSRGRRAQKNDQPEIAIRCYWETVRRDPNDWFAVNQLGRLLHARGDSEPAAALLERAQRLKALLDALYSLHTQPERRDLMLVAAENCEALGRIWEACGWYRAAAALRPELVEPQRELVRLRRLLRADSPQTLTAADRALRLDLSHFPLPQRQSGLSPTRQQPAGAAPPSRARVAFTDVSAAAGVDFTYFNGNTAEEHPLPEIAASMGGGVAVLDFDADGWPDLHFTQGCAWPPEQGERGHVDRLFRNRGDGRFDDVTLRAGTGDNAYSRGVTVGDFDADGFADLYIANVGLNRLYRNNGDGTFVDATAGLGEVASVWTASCLMADVNGDGLPDLFDVTYLAGDAAFERVCYDEAKGAIRTCSPRYFESEPDRLFLNLGDGTFRDVSSEAGILVPEGKGLGVVAATFRHESRLDLFVANDTTANSLFFNETTSPGATPAFVESGLIAGCAYDAQGRARASMGVAIDDVNADGEFDLYITTFFRETYLLLLGQPGGTFVDRTGESGLKEPSLPVLGFGAQFLDADLDGWPDLVVTNGHIDDLTAAGTPYRMRSQFFRNRGQGIFDEPPGSDVGEFFTRLQLGRGLARVDFNRDGREDFVVSHLDTPSALVANSTADAGHFLSVQLRGVDSNREAIGTVVRATTAGETRWKQLTAGDGYQASNQRQLIFGTGGRSSVDELQVRWPSGQVQHFANLTADAEYLLVEGRAEAIRQPR